MFIMSGTSANCLLRRGEKAICVLEQKCEQLAQWYKKMKMKWNTFRYLADKNKRTRRIWRAESGQIGLPGTLHVRVLDFWSAVMSYYPSIEKHLIWAYQSFDPFPRVCVCVIAFTYPEVILVFSDNWFFFWSMFTRYIYRKEYIASSSLGG